MTREIRTERRWLRSVIAASAEPLPALPWMRGARKRPTALTEAPVQAPLMRRDAGLSAGKPALAAR